MPTDRATSHGVNPRAVLEAAARHAVVALGHIELPRRADEEGRAHRLAQRELRVVRGVVRLHPEPVLVVEHDRLVGPRDVLVGVEEAPI